MLKCQPIEAQWIILTFQVGRVLLRGMIRLSVFDVLLFL